jgi:hypothetical protein
MSKKHGKLAGKPDATSADREPPDEAPEGGEVPKHVPPGAHVVDFPPRLSDPAVYCDTSMGGRVELLAAMVTGIFVKPGERMVANLVAFPQMGAPMSLIDVPFSEEPAAGHWSRQQPYVEAP